MEALTNAEALRRTMRGFKIADAQGARLILAALKRITDLNRRRADVLVRVPLRTARPDEVFKLAVERKHLTDLLKMVAYQAESDLVRMLARRHRRAEDEGRTLIQSALAALCEGLNSTQTCFPGSSLRLRFEVKPSPKSSPAFPGTKTAGVHGSPNSALREITSGPRFDIESPKRG